MLLKDKYLLYLLTKIIQFLKENEYFFFREIKIEMDFLMYYEYYIYFYKLIIKFKLTFF